MTTATATPASSVSIRNQRWRIKTRFTTTSPLHIGSGDVTTDDRHPSLRAPGKDGQPGKLNDIQAVVKDYQGRPCLPGTAIKGVLRAWAESVLTQRGDPQDIRDAKARINRIFGPREVGKNSAAEAGWAEFCTATIVTLDSDVVARCKDFVPYWHQMETGIVEGNVQRAQYTGILSHVCIDRHYGTAAHNKLFFEEFVPEGISFDVEIDATRLDEGDIAFLLAVLSQGATHATHPWQFGANGADGWGRMSVGDIKVWQCQSVLDFTETPVGFACCTTPVDQIVPTVISPQPPACISMTLMLACNGPFLVNDASQTQGKVGNDEKGVDDEEADDSTPSNKLPNFVPLRRASGRVWLPASSFRGVLRSHAEFLLYSLNENADPACIERVFGKTSQQSRLRIEEFTEVGKSPIRQQDFVAIDRFTGGAANRAKFDSAFADRPTFITKLTLSLQGLNSADIALLRKAMHDICSGQRTVGWAGSKGYGEFSGLMSGVNDSDFTQTVGAPVGLFDNTPNETCTQWNAGQIRAIMVERRDNGDHRTSAKRFTLCRK